MKKIILILFSLLLCIQSTNIYAYNNNENKYITNVIDNKEEISQEIKNDPQLNANEINKITIYNIPFENNIIKNNEIKNENVVPFNFPWPFVVLDENESQGTTYYFENEVKSTDSSLGPGHWKKIYKYYSVGRANLSANIPSTYFTTQLGFDYTKGKEETTEFFYEMKENKRYIFKTWIYYEKIYISGTYYHPKKSPVKFSGNIYYPQGIRVMVYE